MQIAINLNDAVCVCAARRRGIASNGYFMYFYFTSWGYFVTAFRNVQTLTSRRPNELEIRSAISGFTQEFGWRPSFYIDEKGLDKVTNANILLEQGLEVSAMVSFLRDRDFSSLSYSEIKSLMEISYNNLVDWHIFVDSNSVSIKFNRKEDFDLISFKISESNMDALYYRNIDRLISKSIRGEIDALDEEIIANIARYRRLLHSEIDGVTTENISNLMNSIILIRSMEDINSDNFISLHDAWYQASASSKNVSDFLYEQAKLRNNGLELPEYLFKTDKLKVFDKCTPSIVYQLFKSFYGNSKFKYDFSLMTRHALGKIYEKYVTELEIIKSTQIPLFEGLMISSEKRNYAGGTVYTPQYIASYFSKLAIEYLGNRVYENIAVCDPACGSGVFLRNYVERVLESSLNRRELHNREVYFENIYGLDINENAANASKLSLSLLSLSIFNRLPEALNIIDVDSVSRLPEMVDFFEVIFCNPPYENSDKLEDIEKQNHIKVLGEYKSGTKFDVYLSFLMQSIKALKPGGYGFFVIPQTFLSNAYAEGVRKFISEKCLVHRLVDLSAISDVFSNVSTYVILLVVQKKMPNQIVDNLTQIVIAKSFPGYALEYSLDMRVFRNDYVEVFYRDGSKLTSDWKLIDNDEDDMISSSDNLIKVSSIFSIQQGILSGADDVFIADPTLNIEKEMVVDYLPDRGMSRYSINKSSFKRLIYPYSSSGKLLDVNSIMEMYPKSYAYLAQNREKLVSRSGISENSWWGLTRPRLRSYFDKPKIISPNLVLLPKFSADLDGGVYVSRSTYLFIKDSVVSEVGEAIALEMLKFYLGIFNSSVFYRRIRERARRYRGSYIKIEVATLKEELVPDFFAIDNKIVVKMVKAVEDMVSGGETEEGKRIVEEIASIAYGITKNESNNNS